MEGRSFHQLHQWLGRPGRHVQERLVFGPMCIPNPSGPSPRRRCPLSVPHPRRDTFRPSRRRQLMPCVCNLRSSTMRAASSPVFLVDAYFPTRNAICVFFTSFLRGCYAFRRRHLRPPCFELPASEFVQVKQCFLSGFPFGCGRVEKARRP